MNKIACGVAVAVLALAATPLGAFAQNVTNTPPAAAAPAAPPAQTVAPNAGAGGTADAASSAAPPTRRAAPGSDNGGQLASPEVPGGTNHAPDQGPTPPSFSAPATK